MPRKTSPPGQVRAAAMCPQVTRLGSWVEMDHGWGWQRPGGVPASASGVWLGGGLGKGWGGTCIQGVTPGVRRGRGGECSIRGGWMICVGVTAPDYCYLSRQTARWTPPPAS